MDLLYSPKLLFGISVLSWWLVFTPIAVYYLRLYHRYRNNAAIRHRHYKIVMALGVICIFFWSIERPIQFLWRMVDSQQVSLDVIYVHILEEVHIVLFPVTLYTFTWTLSLRYYLIWFDIKFYGMTFCLTLYCHSHFPMEY